MKECSGKQTLSYNQKYSPVNANTAMLRLDVRVSYPGEGGVRWGEWEGMSTSRGWEQRPLHRRDHVRISSGGGTVYLAQTESDGEGTKQNGEMESRWS